MRRTPRSVFGWVTSTMLLKRWQFIGIALGLGLVIASVVYLGRTEAQHAQQQRDLLARNARRQQRQIADAKRDRRRLADAIHRLQRLEHPTAAQRRREILRLINGLRHLTPVETQRLRDVLLGGGTSSGGTGSPSGGHGFPGHHGSPSPNPVSGPRPPGTPSPPPSSPFTPSPQPPGIDLPPVDPDGSGPLPAIDPPPIPLSLPPLPTD